MDWEVIIGDCLEALRSLPAGEASCIVTSPPYWRQRQYTDDDPAELGLERTLSEFVGDLVAVFRELRRAARGDAVAFVNLGDCWNGTGRAGGDYRPGCKRDGQRPPPGRWDKAFKKKDLVLVPAAVAQTLRDEGWYLRQEIIWSKGWVSPGSAADRPVTTHETVFMLATGARYRSYGASQYGSVWEIPPARGAKGHHAAMPEELARRCIEIGSQPGELVIDPFAGTGTTGAAAVAMGRRFWGAELSDEHAAVARARIGAIAPCSSTAADPRQQLALF